MVAILDCWMALSFEQPRAHDIAEDLVREALPARQRERLWERERLEART